MFYVKIVVCWNRTQVKKETGLLTAVPPPLPKSLCSTF